jgi:transposase InsO family protein
MASARRLLDEYSRECLTIDVGRKVTREDIRERLSELFVRRGVPKHIRGDNRPEFTARRVREWLGRVGVGTLFVEPGSPWEDGSRAGFHGQLRDELLDREIFRRRSAIAARDGSRYPRTSREPQSREDDPCGALHFPSSPSCSLRCPRSVPRT